MFVASRITAPPAIQATDNVPVATDTVVRSSLTVGDDACLACFALGRVDCTVASVPRGRVGLICSQFESLLS